MVFPPKASGEKESKIYIFFGFLETFSLYFSVVRSHLHKMFLETWSVFKCLILPLKVLGKSVGLCKTTKRKDHLYIS